MQLRPLGPFAAQMFVFLHVLGRGLMRAMDGVEWQIEEERAGAVVIADEADGFAGEQAAQLGDGRRMGRIAR